MRRRGFEVCGCVCVCVRRGVEEEDGEDGEDGAAAMARAFTHVRSAVWLRESVRPSVGRWWWM